MCRAIDNKNLIVLRSSDAGTVRKEYPTNMALEAFLKNDEAQGQPQRQVLVNHIPVQLFIHRMTKNCILFH